MFPGLRSKVMYVEGGSPCDRLLQDACLLKENRYFGFKEAPVTVPNLDGSGDCGCKVNTETILALWNCYQDTTKFLVPKEPKIFRPE